MTASPPCDRASPAFRSLAFQQSERQVDRSPGYAGFVVYDLSCVQGHPQADLLVWMLTVVFSGAVISIQSSDSTSRLFGISAGTRINISSPRSS
jgi:hypothetical protein